MTKKKKIELLINDNKRLMGENKRLHEINNEEISENILSEIERYSKVVDKLYEKYEELEQLKITGIKNRWKYRIMFLRLKTRRIFGI